MGFRHRKGTTRPTLDDIFNSPDPHGFLQGIAPKKRVQATAIEVTRFEELNQFVDLHGRTPSADGDLFEKQLHRRLRKFIDSPEMQHSLKPHDRHGLLPDEKADDEPVLEHETVEVPVSESIDEVSSLEDIWSSSAFAQFGGGDSSILEMTHVKPHEERNKPDEVAKKKPCLDFFNFKSIFEDTHVALNKGEVEVVRFSREYQVEAGDMFILHGMLCLVDEIGEFQEDDQGRYNPRIRVIYENGTEANLLLRSLGRGLYKDDTGRRIIRDADSVVDSFNNISHKDNRSGQIYFVRTLSDNPDLKAIPNLIKIGYTEKTVEERTKNAERDTAFLESPVQIVAAIECFNLNPHRFETLIHGFLHAQRLTITLTGKDGNTYHPKEWFSVPLDTAREVVRRIIDGSIVQYRMNNTTGQIVPKRPRSP